MNGLIFVGVLFVVLLLAYFVMYLQERHASPPWAPAVKPIVYDPESYGNQ